MQADRKN